MSRPLVLCVVACLCVAARAEAHPSARKTILDDFLALKTDYPFGPDQDGREARLASIKERDLGRGYLRIANEAKDRVEMKLFRRTDGTDLIAQGFTGCCCEGQCWRRIRFLAVAADAFKDVTGEVWPQASGRVAPEVALRGSHRSGRAEFPHPALRNRGLRAVSLAAVHLGFGKWKYAQNRRKALPRNWAAIAPTQPFSPNCFCPVTQC